MSAKMSKLENITIADGSIWPFTVPITWSVYMWSTCGPLE